MKSCGRLVVALGLGLAMEGGAFAEDCTPSDAVLLILDASYSMLKRVNSSGISRFAAARIAADATIDMFPDDGFLALRLYGSQTQVGRMDCTDTVLSVPFGPAKVNRDLIKSTLADSHARGMTPISYSLNQAIEDFPSDTIQRTIVLLSDGGESCNGDACATAQDLGDRGYIINVVGFMPDAASRKELKCIAAVSKGTYYDVPTALQLDSKLRNAFGVCAIAALPSPDSKRRRS